MFLEGRFSGEAFLLSEFLLGVPLNLKESARLSWGSRVYRVRAFEALRLVVPSASRSR